jgi:hypothetical protein
VNVDAEFQTAFDKAIADQVTQSRMPVSEWHWSGPSKPESEVERWRKLGPQVVQNYIDWYKHSDYDVWITPDGRPAVELELDVMFGSIPVRMVIDAILVNDFHLLVQDTKSGAKVPDSGLQQVGFYACGVELAYGIRPLKGSYFMARGIGSKKDIFLTEPRDLTAWELSVEFFTQQLEAMERAIEAEAFISRVGKHCNRCDVAKACAAVGGLRARDYDPDHPGYVEF